MRKRCPEHGLFDALVFADAQAYTDANVKLDPAKQLLVVSSIFRWFKGDFGGQAGIISFLIDHLPDDGRRAWLSKNQHVIQLIMDHMIGI